MERGGGGGKEGRKEGGGGEEGKKEERGIERDDKTAVSSFIVLLG